MLKDPQRRLRGQGRLRILDHLYGDELERAMPDPQLDADSERQLAIALFNGTWTLMEKQDRTQSEDDDMLHMAHAARHHWGQVGRAAHVARGEWQCSRVYAVLGRAEPSLHHAQRCLDVCTANELGDWDLAFAYEALARGHALAGDMDQARALTEQAVIAADDVKEEEDRELVLNDLESIPGQKRFW